MRQLYLAEKRRKKISMLRWMKIEYYLTEEKSETKSQVPVYGMSIVKKDGSCVEIENSGGVSHSSEVVKGMLHALAKGAITPISMIEVVDELVTTRLCS
jgi:hypothetical protein